MTFEFKKVQYKLDTNTTSEDMFLETGNSNGKFHAVNPLVDGTTNKEDAAVGREPLVQVLVKNTKGLVI